MANRVGIIRHHFGEILNGTGVVIRVWFLVCTHLIEVDSVPLRSLCWYASNSSSRHPEDNRVGFPEPPTTGGWQWWAQGRKKCVLGSRDN